MQIETEKDLPANEQDHLLRGMNLQDESIMPNFWYSPRWGREFDVMPYRWNDRPDVSREF